MTQRKVQETSVEAFRSLDSVDITERHQMILSALKELKEATTEEVCSFLKVPHAMLWKRFSELEKKNLIYKPGDKRPLRSGRSGFVWKIVEPPKENNSDSMWKQEQLF